MYMKSVICGFSKAEFTVEYRSWP